jgi:hypothetical protein
MKKQVWVKFAVFLALGVLVIGLSFVIGAAAKGAEPPFGVFKNGYLGSGEFLAIERVSFSAQSRFLFFGLISWVLFGSLYFLIGLFRKINPLLSRLFLVSFLASILLAATTALFSPRRKTSFDFENKKISFIYSRYLFFPVTQTLDFSDVISVSEQIRRRAGLWICEVNLKPKNAEPLLLGYCVVKDSLAQEGKVLLEYLDKKMKSAR